MKIVYIFLMLLNIFTLVDNLFDSRNAPKIFLVLLNNLYVGRFSFVRSLLFR